MNKEELEKEAIRASDKKCVKGCSKYYRYGFQDGYITGAESREKQIAELEQQIEKMKSCVNCRYCINEECPWQPKGCGMKHWELRR